MPELGRAALVVCLGLALYAAFAGGWGAHTRRRRLALSAQNALLASFGGAAVASGVLLAALLRSDFSFTYVSAFTSNELPFAYKLSAFWGGQEGSLLLWLLVLSLVAMASSAYVKWRVVAGALSLAFFFILTGVSQMINGVFRVTWGYVLDPAWAVNRVWRALLGLDPLDGPGALSSIVALAVFVLLLVLVIERKLRPVEVVR